MTELQRMSVLETLLVEAQRRGLVPSVTGYSVESWVALTDRVRAQILADAVPEQRDFILDRAEWLLAVCGRQCGKGWSVVRKLILSAMSSAGAVCLYVRRTIGLAVETLWDEPKDGLPVVLRELGLEEDTHYTLNISRHWVTFANGSVIRFDGIERSHGWLDVRGKKYALIVLDEMQEQDDAGLRQALDADVPACFMRYGGSFCGIATPGHVAAGRLYRIFEDLPGLEGLDLTPGLPSRTGWALHRWTSRALRDKTPVWDGLLSWKTKFKIEDSNPKWRRDGLGEWAADDTDLMLSLPPSGLWDGKMPDLIPSASGVLVPRRQPRRFVAGLDFGFVKPGSIVVCSVSKEEGKFREEHSEKRAGLFVKGLVSWMREVMALYPGVVFYADSAEPGKVEELQVEHGLPVLACDKSDYEIRLSAMRSALVEGRLQVREGSVLREELRTLSPDPKKLLAGETRPKDGQDDHAFDAFRYAWNAAFHEYVDRPEPPTTAEDRERALFEQDVRRAMGDSDGEQKWRRGKGFKR